MVKPEALRQEQLKTPIREYVTKKLVAVDIGKTIREAAQKMVEFGISSIAIEDEGAICGFITDTDLKEKVVAAGRSPAEEVKEIMTTDLITADINDSVDQILRLMADNKIKHVLIRENKEITGIITLRDVQDISRQKLETYIARE
jgi:CBS domain-containing protein